MATRRQRTEKPGELTVVQLAAPRWCVECEVTLERDDFARMEGERRLCLTCADLGHLVYLPRGDTALTRRAGKHSRIVAIVIDPRARKRYQRQGILVEEAALERAEAECLADADVRERARARAAVRRDRQDAEYVEAFARRVGELFPSCPPETREEIARHACTKHSGRVGRSAAAKELAPKPVDLAVRAHVRHVHTAYDELLARGVERMDARARVADDVRRVLESWRGREFS